MWRLSSPVIRTGRWSVFRRFAASKPTGSGPAQNVERTVNPPQPQTNTALPGAASKASDAPEKKGGSSIFWLFAAVTAGATAYAFMYPDKTIKPFLQMMRGKEILVTSPQSPSMETPLPYLKDASDATSQVSDVSTSSPANAAIVIADVVETAPPVDSEQQHEIPSSPATAAPEIPGESEQMQSRPDVVPADPCAAMIAEAVKTAEKVASDKCLAALNKQEELLDEDIDRAEREFRIQMRKEKSELAENLQRKHQEEMKRLADTVRLIYSLI